MLTANETGQSVDSLHYRAVGALGVGRDISVNRITTGGEFTLHDLHAYIYLLAPPLDFDTFLWPCTVLDEACSFTVL